MNGFLYTLTLEEPVLANSLGGEPNSANSFFYIPGGAIRGAAIQSYGKKVDAEEPEFQRLFLNGTTRFLNAYPLVENTRSLPAPLTWQTERKPAHQARKKIYRDTETAPKDQDVKSVPFDFWFMNNGALKSVEEQWQINVHTQRDAVLGRATSEAGAVYRYTAIPCGMQLQGAVLTETPEDARKLRSYLEGKTVLLGKARTAGYGHARVETEPLPTGWRELPQKLTVSDTITLTFLSHAILRDVNGQHTLDIEYALGRRLGVELKVLARNRKPEIIAGFNRTWGLPLPQAMAIAAGSVFVVKVNVSVDKLLDLEATGLGERRAEGFGRVAINLDVPPEMDWDPFELDLRPSPAGVLSQNDPLARGMMKRLLRRDLDEQVLRCARSATQHYVGGIPNSQLSRWRVIVRDALEKNDLPRLKKFAEESKGKPGWKKMERARISFRDDRPRLTEWIEDLLETPEILNQSWEKEFVSERKLGDNSISVDPDLNIEYRLRLLDAVLAIMSKKSGGNNGN